MDLDLKIQANFHPFWILFFNGFPAVFPQTTFFFSPRPLSVRPVAAAFGRCIAARSPRHAPRDPGQPNRSITMRCASPMNAGRHPATIPGWAYRYWPSSLAPGIAGRPQKPCGTRSTRTAGWIISVRAMIPDVWSSPLMLSFAVCPWHEPCDRSPSPTRANRSRCYCRLSRAAESGSSIAVRHFNQGRHCAAVDGPDDRFRPSGGSRTPIQTGYDHPG